MATWEELKKINESLGTIDIEKGEGAKKKVKKYVMVKDRILAFRELNPNGSIITDLLSSANGTFICKTTVKDEDGNILGTGLSYESENRGFINKSGSALENAETSSIGRALGAAGYGIDGSMASAEEVATAIMNQGAQTAGVTQPEKALLSAFCDLSGLNLQDELHAVGWKQGEQLSRIDYNKIIVNLVNKYKSE